MSGERYAVMVTTGLGPRRLYAPQGGFTGREAERFAEVHPPLTTFTIPIHDPGNWKELRRAADGC